MVPGEAVTHRSICETHTFSAWTTAQRANEAGEWMFVFQRVCTLCQHVDEERGAIVEEQAPRNYAKSQEVNDEPDD
jgi:hypothetical protein